MGDMMHRGVLEILKSVERAMLGGVNHPHDVYDGLRYAVDHANNNTLLDVKGEKMTADKLASGWITHKYQYYACRHIVGRCPDVKIDGEWFYICASCFTLHRASEVDKVLKRTPEDWFTHDEWERLRDTMNNRRLTGSIVEPIRYNLGRLWSHTDGSPLDNIEYWSLMMHNVANETIEEIKSYHRERLRNG